MNNDASKKRFLSGVSALTLSTVIVKVIGLVYKIPMMHSLGAEGMGYFNSAYELYTLFFVIATAGLPVAVSILISESLAHGRLRNVKKIYRISFALFFGLGLVGALVMSLCAGWFAELVGSPDSRLCIALIAPTVFFVAVASAVRGYFQGNQNMVPTAVSQVIEALGKLILGILLAGWAIHAGWPPARAAALAVLGLVAGSAISMLYLLISQSRRRISIDAFDTDLSTDSTRRILSKLLILAVPVTVSASLSSLTRVVDMTLILRRLADIGFDPAVAAAMFGSYSTLAVPIYHLPSSLIAGISVSLVPSLTDAVESGSREREERLVGVALRLCAFVAMPCALGMSVFSRPILGLLFSGQSEPVELAAPLLSVLGLSVLSSCLMNVTNAVLQAHRKAAYPNLSMLAGTAVKVVAAYVLIGIPEIGMMGAPLSTLLCNIVAVGMNFAFMEKCNAFSGSLYAVLMKPLAASSAAMIAALATYLVLTTRLPETAAFLLALAVCGVVYLVSAVKLGALEAEDMALLPAGDRLARFIEKRNIKNTLYKKKGQSNGKQTGNLRAAPKG